MTLVVLLDERIHIILAAVKIKCIDGDGKGYGVDDHWIQKFQGFDASGIEVEDFHQVPALM